MPMLSSAWSTLAQSALRMKAKGLYLRPKETTSATVAGKIMSAAPVT